MTDRKLIMLAIFLVGILAIGAASAAENTTQDITSSNNQIGDDADSLSQNKATTDNLKTTENDIMAEGPKTFTDLNKIINGNTSQKEIYLTEDYTYNPDNDTAFKDGIIFNRDVTVYGNGHTLDGNRKARIFNAESSNVVVHDVIFVNGFTQGDGGAMNYGSATNCTFTNNTANFGGAMHSGSATNCTFTNNTANFGGAMFGGSATNCTFTNNKADTNGGAMEHCSAINSTFTNNKADNIGGAISEGSATNCTFTKNTASLGGAMQNTQATNCTFTNNTATIGGAMHKGSAENSIFKDNHVLFDENNNLDDTTTRDCIFVTPDTTTDIVVYSENIVFKAVNDIPDSIENPVIIFNKDNEIINTANITINGRTITVSGLNSRDTYEICYYNATINDNGDKNYNRVKASVKANSTVNAEDAAVLYGNPISIQVTSTNATNVTYKITNSTNQVVAEGTIKANDTISISTLPVGKYTVNLETVVDEKHNRATHTSKLMITDGTTFWDLNKTINNNTNKDIYLNGNYKYNPDTDSEFKDGITPNRDVTIHGNGHTLDGNRKARIFNAESSNVVVHDVIFVNGHTEGSGGAMYYGSATNCTFTNNHADIYGGAMTYGSATNCTFTNNTADNLGGAAYYCTAINCTFTNNHAENDGGAMRAGSATNCTFTNNTAEYGGAMYNAQATNCTFTNNHATEGGAMYNAQATNCTFTNNTANKNGGAIYYDSAENSIFKDNHLTTGENNDLDDTSSKNCIFISPNATTIGSVAYLEDVVFKAANDIPENIENPVIIFNSKNEIINTANITINGRTITVNGLNSTGNYEICYYNETINNGDKNYNRLKVSVLKANSTVNAEDAAVLYGNPISIQVTSTNATNVTYTITNSTNQVVANGTIKANDTISLSSLPVGKYTVNLTTVVDEKHNRATHTSKLMITDGTTFWDLNKTINNNTNKDIYLNRDYKYNPDTDSEFKDGITPNRDVTVHGNGHTLDGNYGARIFNITSNVTVRDITFANGYSEGNGGAMNHGSTINCTFTNNKAKYEGGAMQYGSATNCTFTNNKAGYGGAMSEGSATNCTFTNNQAKGTGGAMIYGSATNCTFTNNQADTGGAMYKGSATNCTFTNNNAHLICGGATHGTTVENSIFKDNYARLYDNDASGGSAKNCIFIGPTSKEVSTVYPENTITFETTNALLTKDPVLIFNSNNELIDNAAITVKVTRITVSGLNSTGTYEICYYKSTGDNGNKNYTRVKASVLKANSTINAEDAAVLYGDPISIQVTSTNATNVTYKITNNNNETVANGTIKANDTISLSNLPVGKYTVNLTTVTDENHNTTTHTSKLMITDGTTFWDLNKTINNNNEKNIYLDKDYKYNPDTDSEFKNGITINRNVTVHGNGHTLDGNYGARIFNITSNVTVHDITFVNGYTEGNGGAMNHGSAINCTFTNNTAYSGGAIANVLATNCTFTNNNADYDGGAMYGGSATNCTFTNNNAAACGGAMYGGSATNCTFTNNQAENGGAMYRGSATNCTFTNNNANLMGGGATYDTTVENSIFKDNYARLYDNDIYGGSAKNCIFIGPTSKEVSTVYPENTITFETTNALLTKDPVLIFNSNNEIINTANITINGRTITVSGLNSTGDYEICYYNETINETSGDKNYNRVKASVLKANSTVNAEDVAVPYGSPISIQVTSTNAKNVTYKIINDKREVVANGTLKPNDTIALSTVLPVGNYTVNLTTIVDENHIEANATTKLTVERGSSEIRISINSEYYAGQKITITLTPVNSTGNINVTVNGKAYEVKNNKVEIDNGLANGTYTIKAILNGDDNYKNASASEVMTVLPKEDASINIDAPAITFGEDAIVTVILPEDAKGNVTIGKEAFSLTTGISTAVFTNLPAGNNTIPITYPGDEKYNPISIYTYIYVRAANSTVSIPEINMVYGQSVNVYPSVTDAVNITAKIDGRDIQANAFIIPLSGLNAGNHTLEVTTVTDENHSSASANCTFNVERAPSGIDVNGTRIYLGDDAILNYTAVNATGIDVAIADWRGNLLSKGTDYNITITDRQIIIRFFDDGTFTVNVTALTDDNHTSATKNVTVNVDPICELEVILTPMNATANYGDIVKWNATIISHGPSYLFNAYIEAYAPDGLVFTNSNDAQINSNHYRLSIPFILYPEIPLQVFIRTIVNETNVSLTLNVSVHDEYVPDSKLENNNASATIKVEYAVADINMALPSDITAGDSPSAEVTLPSDATGNVTFKVDGNEIANLRLINGSANATLGELTAGNHTIEVAYTGDLKYLPNTETATVNVNKKTTKIKATEVTTTYMVDKNLTITITDSQNNPVIGVNVTIDLNGAENYTTGKNGQINLNVANLTPNTYTARIAFTGDETHNGSNTTTMVTINKIRTKISAKAVTATYNINKYLTVTLKDTNGNPISGVKVSVKLSGSKTYKTNKKGQIKVATKGLAPKTYTAKITFKGNDIYANSTSKAKVVIKKAPSKLTAKKKTFRDTDKNKRYAVTLKDSKGQAIKKARVNLKIKDKIYSATTNNRGTAVFNLKLAKGTHTATASFKGNKYYNKAKTVKAKITVKVTWKTVSKGSKNKAMVVKIQRALKHNRYYLRYAGHHLMIDGKYNDCTVRSVKEFQKDNGLKVTGKVDYITAKKLKII